MSNEYPKPKWWRLYAILPLILVLLAIDTQLTLPTWGHRIAQLGIALVGIGLIGLWVVSNTYALACADLEDELLKIKSVATDAGIRDNISATTQELQADHLESERTRSNFLRSPVAKGRNN